MPPSLSSPWADNPLRTRADLERALVSLVGPLFSHLSPAGAGVLLGGSGASFGEQAEAMEGFARPLYGIVPLLMGGARFSLLERLQQGLCAGTDPAHPEYWGEAQNDQRMVEMAAIGFALACVPDKLWEPLPDAAKRRVANWLLRVNNAEPLDCNWHFFRVLVNLGLSRVGIEPPRAPQERSLARIEAHYRGDGIYGDGPGGPCDYYNPWAYHTYGLMVASMPHADPELRERFRARARSFASKFQGWFDAGGAAIPFGRSLVYRFAQASFWGALVFADEPALPWGRVKGLLLRHLRHWSRLPIFARDGVLNLGYGYANLNVAEPYSSPCSPYWSCKAFLPLAASGEHPFWQCDEEPPEDFERSQPRVRSVPELGGVLQRSERGVVLLTFGQPPPRFPNSEARYSKFAYSSRFGFSLELAQTRPEHAVQDSMLAFRTQTGLWRGRLLTTRGRVEEAMVVAEWKPLPQVWVRTLLIATEYGWHFRLHRVFAEQPVQVSEQGFALGRDPEDADKVRVEPPVGTSALFVATRQGVSAIVDLAQLEANKGLVTRSSRLRVPLPNTHLLWRRTLLPSLVTSLPPGEHQMGAAVMADTRVESGQAALPTALPRPPSVPQQAWRALAGPWQRQA